MHQVTLHLEKQMRQFFKLFLPQLPKNINKLLHLWVWIFFKNT